jgi:hypothetical protein
LIPDGNANTAQIHLCNDGNKLRHVVQMLEKTSQAAAQGGECGTDRTNRTLRARVGPRGDIQRRVCASTMVFHSVGTGV